MTDRELAEKVNGLRAMIKAVEEAIDSVCTEAVDHGYPNTADDLAYARDGLTAAYETLECRTYCPMG